jgi:nucleotide-binding universal stress UspA family protein
MIGCVCNLCACSRQAIREGFAPELNPGESAAAASPDRTGSLLAVRVGMNTNGFRRILVPTDFSPCAEAALRQAIGMAKSFGARITLVHAYLPHFYQSPPRGFVPDEEELQRLAATSERELGALCDRYAASGVTIERRALVGAIPDAILDVAAEGYDLIAMGTHGAGGVKELFLGSVAEKVVRRAKVPVLTVRG